MTRPPFPGPPPWWPSVWVCAVGFQVAGIGAALAVGARWSIGSLCASLMLLALTWFLRWRWNRWLTRKRIWLEWVRAEFAAGRVPIEFRIEREA